MHNSRIPKSFSTATATATGTSVTASGVSPPESPTGQRQQVSFIGLSATVHTPVSTLIPTTHHQQDELRLLSAMSVPDISASQVDPFETLATHRTVTFDDNDQEQFDDFSPLIDELLQPVEGSESKEGDEPEFSVIVLPTTEDGEGIRIRTMTSIPKHQITPSINDHFRRTLSGTVPEALLAAIVEDPRYLSGAHLVDKEPNPTDEWIMWTGDKTRPFKCGDEGCDKHYLTKKNSQLHLSTHTGDSHTRCYLGECLGKTKFRTSQKLLRHIHINHTFERPYKCELCGKRCRRSDHLKAHKKRVHITENEQKSPKRKKK